jgi:hypothetical protein
VTDHPRYANALQMDAKKRKGLEKLRESLLLAAEDMAQAMAAATALRTDTSDDEAWRRALETAMAVSYMRPFTRGAWTLPSKYVPKTSPEKGCITTSRICATRFMPIPTGPVVGAQR